MKEKEAEAALKELFKMIGYDQEGLLKAKKDEDLTAEMPKDYVHTVVSVYLSFFSFKYGNL